MSEEEALRRLQRELAEYKKESGDKHMAVRTELEGVRDEVRNGHQERRDMHLENSHRFDAQDVALRRLIKIEDDKAAARKERERLAKTVSVVFKVLGAILGAAVAAAGFIKLVWELLKTHKP